MPCVWTGQWLGRRGGPSCAGACTLNVSPPTRRSESSSSHGRLRRAISRLLRLHSFTAGALRGRLYRRGGSSGVLGVSQGRLFSSLLRVHSPHVVGWRLADFSSVRCAGPRQVGSLPSS